MLTGKELKIKRIILDIKAIEIAKHLQVHKSYISILEKGTQKIPKHIYVKWITYLNEKESVQVCN